MFGYRETRVVRVSLDSGDRAAVCSPVSKLSLPVSAGSHRNSVFLACTLPRAGIAVEQCQPDHVVPATRSIRADATTNSPIIAARGRYLNDNVGRSVFRRDYLLTFDVREIAAPGFCASRDPGTAHASSTTIRTSSAHGVFLFI